MIGDPGHGKGVVDEVNTCDKRYLMRIMCMTGTPEADDSESRINAHSMVGSASCSLTEEYKRLTDDGVRINDVKLCRYYKKKEENIKVKTRDYHLQHKDKVEMAGIKKKYIGFRKGHRNGISSIYNIRCVSDLGIGKTAIRRIPCAYSFA